MRQTNRIDEDPPIFGAAGLPPRTFGRLVRVTAVLLLMAVSGPVSAVETEPPSGNTPMPEGSASSEGSLSVEEIERQIAAGNLQVAAQALRTIPASEESGLTLTLARMARALQQSGELKSAAEFYRRSVASANLNDGKSIPEKQIALIRLAATSTLLQVGELESAAEALQGIQGPLSDSQRAMVVQLGFRIGSTAFSVKDHASARKAYLSAKRFANEQEKPTASLGAAWAFALAGTDPMKAASELAKFVEQNPDHDDAPRATRACAACLKQAEKLDDANAMLADLLRRWPTSRSAVEIVRSQSAFENEGDEIAPAVADWLMSEGTELLDSLDANAVQAGLWVATKRNDPDIWGLYSHRLAAIDQSGQASSDALERLSADYAAEAERLAAILLSPTSKNPVTAAAREAACRWAGRTQRWSMLALASESESPEQTSDSRTPSVERLFAEALMQTGRSMDAKKWWDYLVDHREADDFATLLRCAETETSFGKDTAKAAERIQKARIAAGDNSFRTHLVDLLDAEVAIRKTRFDQARSLLERVVRTPDGDAGLRGRAQWLIGETHFMQTDFANAIESYRRVEGIDGSGIWVAPSLLQAGKAFEQLGRTREAAVCYWQLVNRFAESPHAGMARRRLAAIEPNPANPNAPQSTGPTLRR